MAKMISRLYADPVSAKAVATRFRNARFPRHLVDVIEKRDGDKKADLTKRLSALEIDKSAVDAYAGQISKEGAAAVTVRATYKPLNAPRIAREIFASSDAVDLDVEQEVKVKDVPEPAPSVLKSHPRFLTPSPADSTPPRGPVTKGMGWKMLSTRDRKISANTGLGQIFGNMIPSLSTKERKISARTGIGLLTGKMMSPLSKSRRSKSVIEGGGAVFSRAMGMPVVTNQSRP